MKKLFLAFTLLTSLNAFARSDEIVNAVCKPGHQGAHFDSLEIVTQPSGKMRGRVTVGGNRETYSYFVRRLPPIVRRNSGSLVYRAALARFQLNICTTCDSARNQAFTGSVILRTPKRARFFAPDQIIEFKNLACVIK